MKPSTHAEDNAHRKSLAERRERAQELYPYKAIRLHFTELQSIVDTIEKELQRPHIGQHYKADLDAAVSALKTLKKYL